MATPHVVDPKTGQLVRLDSPEGSRIFQMSQSGSFHGAPSTTSQLSSRAASLQWGASPAEWSTSHTDCCDDCGICCKGCWCPCELHGDIKEHIMGKRPEGGGYTFLCVIQFLFCINCVNCTTCCKGKPLRKRLRQMYGLRKTDGCGGSDCCTHFCCHYCSQCQEAREIDFRAAALESTLAGHSKGAEMTMQTMQQPIVMVPPDQQQLPQAGSGTSSAPHQIVINNMNSMPQQGNQAGDSRLGLPLGPGGSPPQVVSLSDLGGSQSADNRSEAGTNPSQTSSHPVVESWLNH